MLLLLVLPGTSRSSRCSGIFNGFVNSTSRSTLLHQPPGACATRGSPRVGEHSPHSFFPGRQSLFFFWILAFSEPRDLGKPYRGRSSVFGVAIFPPHAMRQLRNRHAFALTYECAFMSCLPTHQPSVVLEQNAAALDIHPPLGHGHDSWWRLLVRSPLASRPGMPCVGNLSKTNRPAHLRHWAQGSSLLCYFGPSLSH
ncbi:hypothetical protein BDP81DRAFT_158970 [Colletotrichum phormii]|uniref:Uncharacterized protein n=1 Tax=Colletotrichum phormii TaxID=359342 RepID=A0AAI9ZXP7_9PEZI|nr:uncharacterized protein BDP81DRAFT_158970 [Colletotrichum phormii]KAK1640145.1 hypothetical protein BDP81DRAFT_158970 [Colletotrichum phormii]